MSLKGPKVKVGEEWAYRRGAREVVTCVQVSKIGSARPPRVKIRFVDDVFEGREEWVPPTRLKVRWVDVDAWMAREARWDAVSVQSGAVDDTPEFWAAAMVFDIATSEDVLTMGHGRHAGVLCISDVTKAVELLGVESSVFLADQLTFVDDDGTLVAPWGTTLALARSTAAKYAQAVLRYVTEQERKAAHDAVYGEVLGSRRARPWYVSPEVCAKADSHWVPAYDLMREWCGVASVDNDEELRSLREETLRISQIADSAITALEAAGLAKIAAPLRRQLGVPHEVLNAAANASR